MSNPIPNQVRRFLVSTTCILTGRRAVMRLAAYSGADAEYIGSAVGYPVTVVAELDRQGTCDNERVMRLQVGDLNAFEPCYVR